MTATNRTGMTSRVKNIEKIRPNASTLARGLQSLDPDRIMGTTHGGSHGGKEDRPKPALTGLGQPVPEWPLERSFH